MKKLKNMVIIALFIITIPVLVSAHSGRTDSNGGHWDYSTGTYHYHNGGGSTDTSSTKKNTNTNKNKTTNTTSKPANSIGNNENNTQKENSLADQILKGTYEYKTTGKVR